MLRSKRARVQGWDFVPPLTTHTHTHTHTVLTPADDENHIDKHQFKVPFVCGARNLGEALRRIAEGAAMIRTKGEAGTGEGEREREGRHKFCAKSNLQLVLHHIG